MDSIVITTADVRGPPPYGEGGHWEKYYIVISKTDIDIKYRVMRTQSGSPHQIYAITDLLHLKVSIPEFMINMIKQLLPSDGYGYYIEHYRCVFKALEILSEEKIFNTFDLKKENDRLRKFLDIERKELEIVKSYLKKEQSTNVNILVDKNELDRIKTLLKTEQSTNILIANKNYELNRENETLQKELDVVKSLLKKEQSITKSYLEENEKIKKDNNGIIEKLGVINKKFQEIKKIIYKKTEL